MDACARVAPAAARRMTGAGSAGLDRQLDAGDGAQT